MTLVTVEEVREALPWGVVRRAPSFPWHKAIRYIPVGRYDAGDALAPDQIAAAINERCGTCEGRGQAPNLDPHLPDDPCPSCRDSSGNPTGSAAPALLELVRHA